MLLHDLHRIQYAAPYDYHIKVYSGHLGFADCIGSRLNKSGCEGKDDSCLSVAVSRGNTRSLRGKAGVQLSRYIDVQLIPDHLAAK